MITKTLTVLCMTTAICLSSGGRNPYSERSHIRAPMAPDPSFSHRSLSSSYMSSRGLLPTPEDNINDVRRDMKEVQQTLSAMINHYDERLNAVEHRLRTHSQIMNSSDETVTESIAVLSNYVHSILDRLEKIDALLARRDENA